MFIFKEIYYFVVDFPEHLKDWKEDIKWEINEFKERRQARQYSCEGGATPPLVIPSIKRDFLKEVSNESLLHRQASSRE